MKKTNRVAAVLLALAILTWTAPRSRGEEKPTAGPDGSHEHMGMGMGMGKMGMMDGHMMPGGPMMMGGCPMMDPHVSLKVEKIKNGATLTLTSEDPKVVRRIQIHAEIMRLMHELHSEEGSVETK